MNLWNWMTGGSSDRSKAMSLYHRGMKKAKKHDHAGAITDYSLSIGAAETPPDVKAMVLYNRALVYVASGDLQKGTDDLNAVLAIDDAPVNVKTMARNKIIRMESRAKKT